MSVFDRVFVSCALTASSLCNGDDDTDAECIVCSDAHAEVVFRPCGHRIVCVPCSVRMKKCIQCRAIISCKLGPGQLSKLTACASQNWFHSLLQRVTSLHADVTLSPRNSALFSHTGSSWWCSGRQTDQWHLCLSVCMGLRVCVHAVDWKQLELSTINLLDVQYCN